MSLYGKKFSIGGIPCGLVLRMGTTGKYRVTFEREYATLEQVEAISWDPPVIEGEGCILPSGYGFEVDQIEYDSSAMLFHVTVHTGEQYYGDVSAYEAEVAQLQEQVGQQAETITQQEATIQTQTATIDSQAATIEELEVAGTAESVKTELRAAYEEGVESNG